MLDTLQRQSIASKKRNAQLLSVLVVLALGALTLLRADVSFNQIMFLLHYPYPHDGLEGTLLHEAALLWSGHPLYQPLELYRFVSAPYPPLHPAVLGWVAAWQGEHVFWSGRLISLTSCVLVALFAALLIGYVSRSWPAALIGAIMLASTPPMILWATRIKPDLFALMWTTLGLYLATLALGATHRHRWLIVVGCAVCFTLALFTKHTALAAPFASGVALVVDDIRCWFRGERAEYVGRLPVRRRTLLFGLAFLGLAGNVWAWLDNISQGQFSAHVVIMHRDAVWTRQLMVKYLWLVVPYWPFMLAGVALALYAVRERRALVPACYVLIVPFTLVAAGKTGANHNHLLETLLGLSIASAIMLGWGLRHLALRPLGAVALVALFVLPLAQSFQPQPWFAGELAPSDPPERFVVFMRNTPGEILADDTGLLYMAGKPLRYDDPSSMAPLAAVGLWDQRGLLDDIANRRFSAIMVPINAEVDTHDASGRWTPEMIAAIREHYRLLFRDRINVYTPK